MKLVPTTESTDAMSHPGLISTEGTLRNIYRHSEVIPLNTLGLKPRTMRCLYRNRYTSLQEVVLARRVEIYTLRGIGIESITSLDLVIQTAGFSFRAENESVVEKASSMYPDLGLVPVNALRHHDRAFLSLLDVVESTVTIHTLGDLSRYGRQRLYRISREWRRARGRKQPSIQEIQEIQDQRISDVLLSYGLTLAD